MSILTLEQIVAANDLPEKVITVKAWGGDIRVRSLTKQQQHDVRKASTVDGELDDTLLELNLLVAAVVEPELTPAHIGVLRNKSAEAIDEIIAAVFKLNAMEEGAVDQKRREFQDGPGAVDGAPSCGEAGDDGQGVAASPDA